MTKSEALKTLFGHDDFREGQEDLIDGLLSGRDVLGIMPTGGGKSVCYQIPAMLLPGIALVISPLISLMKDQVAALREAGVPAAFLNATLTPEQQALALSRAREGRYKLIYVAPERLKAPSFRSFAESADISLIAVDEAHCVSQWGQDFRPDYLRIRAFLDSLSRRPPVGAYTATATPHVREDIVRLLGLRQPTMVMTGFDRPNLFYEVIPLKGRRDAALTGILQGMRGRSGIVYCATRKSTESVCAMLRAQGFSAVRYHAGLSEEERRSGQEAFQYDRADIMVATNAFGMGIDKSNVSFVIHYNMPRSVEAYYQEAGRAGRDGSEADCVLLYSRQDIVTARYLIEHREPNPELTPEQEAQVTAMERFRLQRMIDLCEGKDCFRAGLLRYFGQPARTPCAGCSRCRGPRWTEPAREAAEEAGTGRRARKAAKPAPLSRPASSAPSDAESELFDRLRACRMDIARGRGVPPYVICHDRTLREIAAARPSTLEELSAIYGMGSRKVSDFGARLLAVVNGAPPSDGPHGGVPASALPDGPPAGVFSDPDPEDDVPIPADDLPPSAVDPAEAPEETASAPSWTAEQTARLFDLWYAGAPMAGIAEELGRDRAEVLLRADDLGILAPNTERKQP